MFLFQRSCEVTDTMSKLWDHECVRVPIRNTSFFESIDTTSAMPFHFSLHDYGITTTQKILKLLTMTNSDNLQHNQDCD